MDLKSIVLTLRHNLGGPILIVAQIAAALAILGNALFIIQHRVALSQRPTGTDESNLFVVSNQWVGNPQDLSARVNTDLVALRSLPGVRDAYVTNAYPLLNDGRATSVRLSRSQRLPVTKTALYFVDEHGSRTLGLRLVAGRDFNQQEVTERSEDDQPGVCCVIVTRALAQKLFPGQPALGKLIYVESKTHAAPIVGIVEKLQAPWTSANGFGSTFSDYSVLEPFRYVNRTSYYLVRAEPGQLAAVMLAARHKLLELSRSRVIQRVQPLSSARTGAYQDDRGVAVILGGICLAMIIATACGIVGLTSYSVTQRMREIGIRRALGATRGGIVLGFQAENSIIALAGMLFGIALSIALNQWAIRIFEVERLEMEYVITGAVLMLLISQLSAAWPALRGASISPASAARRA